MIDSVSAAARAALLVRVTGVVQGVGFRPFVHRLAARHALAGWVRNQAGDVQIAVAGEPGALADFLRALRAEAPPLARIDRVSVERRGAEDLGAFHILPSTDAPDARQPVSPDVSMCSACERELHDPANRRYRYPFITCTDCGPRYSVIEAVPYDRERTSMRAFAQCPACRREYETPGDRRHHSETNSCPVCGPRLRFLAREGGVEREPAGDPLALAAAALRRGAIVALRGLGGFHLAADATNDDAVRALRARKRREAKPFAVMVRTLDDALVLARLSAPERALLAARERPIVLGPLRADSPLAPSVAPGLGTVGLMLPYTPLHHLLLELVGRPLVMTSGNLSDEPLAAGVDEARSRLGALADAFLLHDREIVARIDDSVLRVAGDTPVFLRRARGFAPLPVRLPVAAPVPLVAVGPHLKSTFTLVHGEAAYVSPHVGDLDSLETLEHYRRTLASFERLFRVAPEAVVRDLHPGYLSTRVAGELGLARVIAVQHHHAHVAAVMAEHGVTDRVLGVAFDGTGYGDDQRVWGAELLAADLTGYERVGQLRYAPLPGGELAVRTPWRTALGYLSLEPAVADAFALAFEGVPERERAVAEHQAARALNAPLASSMGRLFDAAAAVLGVRRASAYEGQAAMELESLAGARRARPLPFPFARNGEGRWELDPLPLLAALGERRQAGDDAAELAAAFHESLSAATASLVARVAADAGLGTVALGGGVFQNARLLTGVRARLAALGLTVLVPRVLSPNDGAVSYGQAAVAAARLAREGRER